MALIPISMRKAPAHRELFDQINKYLSKQRLPTFWKGGRTYEGDYQIIPGRPGGMPLAIPIKLAYRQGQKEARIIDQGWRLPLTGPLSGLVELEPPEKVEAPPDENPEPSDGAPEPEPTPRRRSTRRPAATTPPDPEPEATGEE